MANGLTTTLTPDEQVYSRAWSGQRQRGRDEVQRQPENVKSRDRSLPAKMVKMVTESVNEGIEKAYGQLWDKGQSVLENLGTAFYGLLSIVTFVPIVFVYFARLMGRMSARIRFREIQVHLIPPYSGASLMLHTGQLLWNVFWVVIWMTLIIIVLVIYFKATKAICPWAGWLIKMFGSTICNAAKATTAQ